MLAKLLRAIVKLFQRLWYSAETPRARRARVTGRAALRKRPNFYVRTMRYATLLRLERQWAEKLRKLDRQQAAARRIVRPIFETEA